MTVRSNLQEYTFLRSPTTVGNLKRLLEVVERSRDHLFTFTQGAFEVTVIISSDMGCHISEIFSLEKLISHIENLSAIIIKLPDESVSTPGTHYSIMKQLAWNNINVVEVVSTFSEYTLVLDKHQVDRAFSVLLNFLGNQGNQRP